MSRHEAMQILQRCQTDSGAMMQLRALAPRHGTGALTDRQVLDALAAMVETHELVLHVASGRSRGAEAGSGGGGGAGSGGGASRKSAADNPFPLTPARSSPSRSAPAPAPAEDPVFPENVNLPVMVEAMRSAAREGMPFCDT